MFILGIDPGSHQIGYGLIKTGRKTELLRSGLLKFQKRGAENLKDIYDCVYALMESTKPGVVAIERIFFFKNQKTVIEVAQSRGVILLAAMKHKLKIIEIAPLQVKLSIAGSGRADKKAIAKMTARILGVSKIEGADDVTDAIALALTAAQLLRYPQ
ncbi:MAG: crossover junction endodeoxyribonuclease RuvC [Parcubacteria group bacterium RIFCSPLOWO2_01_FULL_48_18]|nr:MAG: crossover junction endodeoxyribonuclease RuvC [Parcubacteria group bacterium RIFCSPLOWO2_01_FULL_48_18]OHB23263.1 MAG: crossover junction endodeoxyribonuclease RuvC [Parcubacteria group bacterium RIFCSPHIGHO2_02_FULL_48_10b]